MGRGNGKRFSLPWLSPEDARMLDQLAEYDPEARREMSNLIRAQAREQQRHDRHFSPLEPGELERSDAATGARAAFGTGGGRMRRIAVDPS